MRSRLLLALLSLLMLTAPAAGAVSGNPADRLVRLPIDPYRYDHAKGCRQHPMPGALALVRWLERNARGEFWGIMRCSKLDRGNYSLHAEGRAIDWHLDVARPADRREARRLIGLLLATDRAGNEHALARRMGIQEIIWNCRSWWSGGEGMSPYSVCFDSRGRPLERVDRTLAHRDHIHLGLSLAGARERTSFWARAGS